MATNDIYLETIQNKLTGSAAWRRGLAERYPDDRRNLRAAESLDRLANADGSKISAETWAALAPHLESRTLRDAVSEAARDVDFRAVVDGIDSFLRLVATKLEVAGAAR